MLYRIKLSGHLYTHTLANRKNRATIVHYTIIILNHIMMFYTYSQDKDNRPHKCPNHIILCVKPAVIVCLILVQGNRQGHTNNDNRKAWNSKKIESINDVKFSRAGESILM